MQLRRNSTASILAVASLVGVTAFLSIRDNVPSTSSPFAFVSTVPALWIFELDERVWPSFLLFALACLPVVAAFLASSAHLFRHKREIPKRSVVALPVLVLLSVAWFWQGWSYGIQYQGMSHTLYVAVWNAIFIAAALILLLVNGQTPRFGVNLAFHGVVFSWLAWCAFPWMGELL
jgi:hypothetical protein